MAAGAHSEWEGDVVTFEEARQILAQDERVGRPGYRPPLPPTLAMIRDISEANAVKVCNVGPWEHRLERPSMSVVVPAYKPDQDAAHKGYAESKPFPGIHQFAKQISDGEDVAYTWCQDEGRAALRDLIGIGPGMPMNRSLVHRGVFVPAGPAPTPEEIKTANELLDAFADFLIMEARDAWDLGPVARKEVIGADHYWAGRLRGLSEQWVNQTTTEKSVRCQRCGTWNPPGIAQCSKCSDIIDFELHFKLQQEQAARKAEFEERVTRPDKGKK